MTDETDTLNEREEVELLLPWYVTGRLDAADRRRVEDWLARDGGLARQLELIREEQAAVVAAAEARALPSGMGVRQVIGRIPERRPGAAGWLEAIVRPVGDLFSRPTPGAVRWAALAAGVLILAQAGYIGTTVIGTGSGGYTTASGPGATAEGAFALVRFAGAARISEVSAALAELDMHIADGPRSGGLYRVRIGPAGLEEAASRQRVDALRARSALVELVLPVPAERRAP